MRPHAHRYTSTPAEREDRHARRHARRSRAVHRAAQEAHDAIQELEDALAQAEHYKRTRTRTVARDARRIGRA